MNVRDIISKNITYLRKKNKLTQSELADKLFYSNKAISKWERGDSLPDAEMLKKIADLFNVPVSYLFEEHENDDDLNKEIDNEIKKREIKIKIIAVLIFITAIIITAEASLISFADLYKTIHSFAPYLFIVPFIPLTLLIVNFILGKSKFDRILLVLLVWSFAFALYFFFEQYKPTFVFLIAFLFTLGIYVFPYIEFVSHRKKMKEKNKTEKK